MKGNFTKRCQILYFLFCNLFHLVYVKRRIFRVHQSIKTWSVFIPDKGHLHSGILYVKFILISILYIKNTNEAASIVVVFEATQNTRTRVLSYLKRWTTPRVLNVVMNRPVIELCG